MKRSTIFAAILIAGLGPNAAHPQDAAKGRTILFVDDHDVLYRSGTQRVLQPLKRHSDEAILDMARPWEVGIGYTSVYRDPKSGKYQLWYQAYAGARAGERRLKCVVCYAESKDGIHFERPELDLFPYKDLKTTNIVLVSNAGYGDRYCCSVLVDPLEKDPARRYKMAYYDWSKVGAREEPGLHVAFSPDGIRWTKHPGVLLKTLYGGGAAWKNGIARSESKDFIHWSKPQLVLTPDDDDHPDVEFHGAGGFFHKGRYFALNQVLKRRDKLAIDLELMTSRDGIAWERPFRKEFFLVRSKPGLFDSRTLLSNSTPIVHGDEMRFYYGAANVAPLNGVKSEPSQRSGVGMASIPLDRFAGIRPAAKSAQVTLRKPLENVGQVTLKPLDLKGCADLTLNADASKGSIRVELLNEEGYRMRGFSRDDAILIQGDALRHKIAWRDRRAADLPPGRYLLRLHLENATVFAITFD